MKYKGTDKYIISFSEFCESIAPNEMKFKLNLCSFHILSKHLRYQKTFKNIIVTFKYVFRRLIHFNVFYIIR